MKNWGEGRPPAEDMLKLERAFFELTTRQLRIWRYWRDCKRPFGNSDVEGDILELIGMKPEGDDGEDACWSSRQRVYAAEMYNNLIEWLQMRHLNGA